MTVKEEAAEKKAVRTKQAPQAIGPYSQGIRANGLIFVSGQIAIDPATGEIVPGGIAEQSERVLKNLAAVLQEAGSGLDRVVRSTVYLKNMSDFGVLNEIYGRHFGAGRQDAIYPARSTVEVSRLPKDVLVEIDVIALA